MKIMIAVPCMDMLNVQFVRSLEELDRVGSISTCFCPGSLVYHARNILAKAAVENETDYVLWIDSDMVFEPNTLTRLLEDIQRNEDVDMVAPIMFCRREPFDPVIYNEVKYGLGEVEANIMHDYPRDSLFEVDAVGFGMILMKTEVIKKVMEEFGDHPFNLVPGFGEDLSFCIRAKRKGFHVWCDSRIKIGHVGSMIVNEMTYDVYRNSIAR